MRTKPIERGATSVEYGLMIGLLAIGIITAVVGLQGRVSSTFEKATIISTAGTARESSTLIWSDGVVGDAFKAIDGKYIGNYHAGGVTHTAGGGPGEWWEVDLQLSSNVRKIKIFPRTDCCGDRLTGAYVMLSEEPFPTTQAEALANPSIIKTQLGTTTSDPIDVAISGPARYVRVWATLSTIELTEVEVYG